MPFRVRSFDTSSQTYLDVQFKLVQTSMADFAINEMIPTIRPPNSASFVCTRRLSRL